MAIKDLIPVDYANQRVLIYKQIAQGLDCSIDLLRMHFRNHKDLFKEGVHYFKLEGAPLQEFKKEVINRYVDSSPAQKEINEVYFDSPILSLFKGAKSLLLFTEQGVARLSKLIDTEEAWKLFTALEQNYFKPQAVEEPKKRKSRSDTAHVYAFLMSNATTKIGHSDDIDDRIKRMKREKGLEVMKEHHSKKLPRNSAMRIESTLHRKYARFKVDGEFFNADYADVCDALDKVTAAEIELVEEYETFTPAELTDRERVDRLLEVAKLMEPSPERQAVLIETANLLAGKNFLGD